MALKEITPKLSRTIKSLISGETEESNLSNLSWTANDIQGALTIDEIQDGLIFTSDGNIVSLVEIIPLNYFDLEDTEQDMIADSFGNAFKMLPDKGHFKAMSVATNLDDFEERLRACTANDDSPALKQRVDNYLEVMRLFQKEGNSTNTRFFYIYEYEGNESKEISDNYNDVLRTMQQTQRDIVNAFRAMGNIVIDMQKDISSIAEVLYQFYNPKTSRDEVMSQRIAKVSSTAHWFGQSPCLRDCVCPRGVRYGKWDYVVIDGIYHTYFVLKEGSYPSEAFASWPTQLLQLTDDGDIDIYYKKNLSALNDFLIDRTDVISRGVAHTYDYSDNDRGSDYWDKSNNAKLIKELQKQGEEVYDVCMIVTLRAKSFEELESKKISFRKTTKKAGLEFDTCYLKTQDYFDMVTPLCNINSKIFKQHKRNMTNMGLSSLYMFASYEMFDKNGYWIGISQDNGTLVSIDNYNTKLYTNPHITIMGKPGAGKTVTQLHIANAMRMKGMSTFFILPLKGHEYKDNIHSMGGNYYPLFDSKVCINICEIRPAEILNEDNCRDNEERMELLNNLDSLLALKIEFLINWIRIQLDPNDRLTSEEIGELNTLLVQMYNQRGINDNNLSIFKKVNGVITNELKDMPIIEDMYKLIIESQHLRRLGSILKPWVNGSLQHMNGQTNIPLNNKCIAFDVNEDKLGRYLPAFMLIAFELFYSISRRDMDERCCIVLDETWKFLLDDECSKYIFKMEKILRSYSTTLMCATQQISDCMRNENAKAMLSTPDIKIILKTDKMEVPLLSSLISLSQDDAVNIQNFDQGECFYCYGNNKIKVKIVASLYELYLDEPKESKKKELMKQIQQGYLI